MKTAWLIGWIAAAGVAAQAAPAVTVYVCSDPGVPKVIQLQAQLVAARIFSGIEVPVRWRDGRPPQGLDAKAGVTVAIRLEFNVPAELRPGALGVTMPEKDSPVIHIFYRRVVSLYRPDASALILGYVLAHEMAHVLEGEARHSAEGILKARWTPDDFDQMAARRLEFAAEDARLIRRWVAAKTMELQLDALR